MKTKKFYIAFDTPVTYASNEIEVSSEQYWKEFDNCKKLMNEHNNDECTEEYDKITYDSKTTELETSIQKVRVFYFQSCSVYLTEIDCKPGYKFKTKSQLKQEAKNNANRELRFEVLWYKQDGDYETRCFHTRKSAMKFYEQHKNDKDKSGWWVTHRNSDWEVIEDIVY